MRIHTSRCGTCGLRRSHAPHNDYRLGVTMLPDCVDHGKTRSLSPEGYALVAKPGVRSRCTRLHRLVFAEKVGVPLDDLGDIVVRHTCDNTRCINPAHLIGGSKADNNKDRADRNRSAKSVPSRQALTQKDCTTILARYTPKRCKLNGVVALARDYHVNTSVIYKVVKGTYVADIIC